MTDDIKLAKEIRTAIKQGDLNRVKELIGEDKYRLKMMTVFGTWLHVAASMGKLDIVRHLVQLGADVNQKGGVSGGNALRIAASEGFTEIVKYFLSCGAEMDTSEPERNPLFGAIYNGHTAMAKVLIDHGIDTRIKYNGEFMTNMDALAFAREWGRADIAQLIISAQTNT